MKKRILAIAVTVMMMIAVLAGCTTADIGMLNLYGEMSAIKSAEVSGKLDITMDKKAINDYITSLGIDSVPFNELKLGDKITFSYTGKVNTENLIGVDLSLNVTINNKTIPMGNIILKGDKGIYVSKEYFLGIIEILTVVDPEMMKDGDQIKQMANQIFGDVKYIQIADASDLAEMGTVYMDQQYVLGQNEMDFLTNTFKNYSPGCVTQVSNGYKVSLTLEQMLKICKGSIEYIVNNNDDFINALTTYVNSGGMEKYGIDKATGKELINEVKDNKVLFISQLNMMKSYIETFMASDEIKDFLQTSYSSTTTKVGSGYNGVENLNFVVKGKSLLKIDGESKTNPMNVTVNAPSGKVMTLDELTTSFEKVVNRVNPIEKADIVWDKYDTYALVEYTRGNEYPWLTGKDYERIPYKMVSGSIYLPLRSLGEAFGEEVGWDNKVKKAYIVRNGKNIFMDGMVSEGKTFIKLRDFEKLSYKIDYEYVSGTHYATITK